MLHSHTVQNRTTGEATTEIAYGAYSDGENDFVDMNESLGVIFLAVAGTYFLVDIIPWRKGSCCLIVLAWLTHLVV